MAPGVSVPDSRIASIEIVRAAAILLMVQVHFVQHLSAWEASTGWLYTFSSVIGYLPAPMFCVVAGLSYSLWQRKAWAAGQCDSAIDKATVRRGLALIGLGLLVAFFLWFPEEMFLWDILPLLGASFVLLAPLRRLPAQLNVLIGAMLLLIAPVMRALCDYPAYWLTGEYSYDPAITDIVHGFLANGYFPLIPWLSVPIAGFVVGETIFRHPEDTAVLRLRLVRAGTILVAVSAVLLAAMPRLPAVVSTHYGIGLTFYPASAEYLLLTVGLTLLALAALNRLVDTNPAVRRHGLVMRFLRRYSSFALTVYIAHLAAHLLPLWAYGAMMGHEDPTYYYQRAVTTPTALGLALVFIALFAVVLAALERHRKWSVETLLRWCAD